jgi:glycosyltransferase involved in cell wall biosynthesis
LSLYKKLRICVNSQTPFLKFLLPYSELLEKYDMLSSPVKMEELTPDIDYQFSPGGVTAMIYPLLRRMQRKNIIEDPIWVSLGSNAPSELLVDHIRVYHVQLPEYDMQKYANFKESIWNEIHGIGKFQIRPEEYEAFIRYNWLSTQLMLKLLRDTDLYFIHDFQQLLTGSLIGPSAPAVLQWHIPFRLEQVSSKLKTFILKNIEGFDSIIVSTRRDLEGLIHAGYRGHAYQIYPYIDRSEWTAPRENDIESVREFARLHGNEKLLLVVARMDKIKGQDTAIRALSHVLKARSNVKLLLIGNGSFSGSERGGLAHPKASMWKSQLQTITRELGLTEKVVFAGYKPIEFVRAAYSMADAILVPSKAEGFGLTTIEAWVYKKPVIVSKGAGSSELVIDDVNGYTFDSGNDLQLAEKIEKTLSRGEEAEKMGERGLDSAAICDVERNMASLQRVFEETLSYFG